MTAKILTLRPVSRPVDSPVRRMPPRPTLADRLAGLRDMAMACAQEYQGNRDAAGDFAAIADRAQMALTELRDFSALSDGGAA